MKIVVEPTGALGAAGLFERRLPGRGQARRRHRLRRQRRFRGARAAALSRQHGERRRACHAGIGRIPLLRGTERFPASRGCARPRSPISIDRDRSVKDAIESIGVPHTEVDLILVDGDSVGFEHVLHGGERVAVYPVFERLDIAPLQHLRPRAAARSAFRARHAPGQARAAPAPGGIRLALAQRLRDRRSSRSRCAERRIMLTRDRGLLKRRAGRAGAFRSRHRRRSCSSREVIRVFQLEAMLRPFTRCRECNVALARRGQGRGDRRACRKECGQSTSASGAARAAGASTGKARTTSA